MDVQSQSRTMTVLFLRTMQLVCEITTLSSQSEDYHMLSILRFRNTYWLAHDAALEHVEAQF